MNKHSILNRAKTIGFLLLVSVLASCMHGNKVVSTLGKRKYTRGYYSFFHVHNLPHSAVAQVSHKETKQNNKPQLPASALSKSHETPSVPVKTIINNNKVQKTICLKEERSIKTLPAMPDRQSAASRPEKTEIDTVGFFMTDSVMDGIVQMVIVFFISLLIFTAGIVLIIYGLFYGDMIFFYIGIAVTALAILIFFIWYIIAIAD